MIIDAAWLQRLSVRADQPPARPRAPLRVAPQGAVIGSIEPILGQRLVVAGLPLRRDADGWCLHGTADAALLQLARWLHAEGLASRWRDELLDVSDVSDAEGRALAAIERSAVRPLGITTQAVHLVGRNAAGDVWVQQRALDKATDPGLWDTLMGGLMAAGESIAQTLERETWEEAGLRLSQLEQVAPFGRITIRRPVREGYMVEHIHLFSALVPAGSVPLNQDGEVQAFECLDRAALVERLQADAFTLEAALILAEAMQRL
jgi:8-oxo-dGTP pyrophosphatase MutT (NUDIX family)